MEFALIAQIILSCVYGTSGLLPVEVGKCMLKVFQSPITKLNIEHYML